MVLVEGYSIEILIIDNCSKNFGPDIANSTHRCRVKIKFLNYMKQIQDVFIFQKIP